MCELVLDAMFFSSTITSVGTKSRVKAVWLVVISSGVEVYLDPGSSNVT